jgi:peptidyl-prolyl cis-trans isomerase D
MLKLMRESFNHLKWILLAVVGAFILGFVFIDMGLGGAIAGTSDRTFAARVNGQTITQQEYNRALYYTEQRYKSMYGGQMTPEMLDQMGLPKQVLDSLVDQQLLLQEAKRLHLNATAEEVRKKILEIPILNEGGKISERGTRNRHRLPLRAECWRKARLLFRGRLLVARSDAS